MAMNVSNMKKATLFTSRSLFVIILTAFAFYYLFNYRNNDPLIIGNKAPNFRFKSWDNTVYELNDLHMPVALIFFSKSTMFTSYYLKLIPEIKLLQKQGYLKIVTLIKMKQSKKSIKELSTNKRTSTLSDITYLTDINVVAGKYGIRSFPHFFLIDSNNIVIYQAKSPSLKKIKNLVRGL
jgi:hypothetical protein